VCPAAAVDLEICTLNDSDAAGAQQHEEETMIHRDNSPESSIGTVKTFTKAYKTGVCHA
jgi:hypothetical protein